MTIDEIDNDFIRDAMKTTFYVTHEMRVASAIKEHFYSNDIQAFRDNGVLLLLWIKDKIVYPMQVEFNGVYSKTYNKWFNLNYLKRVCEIVVRMVRDPEEYNCKSMADILDIILVRLVEDDEI